MPLERNMVRVNLTTGKINIEKITKELRQNYLGGRGINMYLLNREVKAGISPFSPENPLIFGAGLLNGIAGGRMNISAKAAESGYLGDANVGGDFGSELAATGFSHLLVEGKSDGPVYLQIKNGQIKICPAQHLWGRDTLETQKAIRKEMDNEEVRIACIGSAGENMVRYAGIVTGRKNIAGRTGLGAVMGSKKVKAVAVLGDRGFKAANAVELLGLQEKMVQKLSNTKWIQTLGTEGTPLLLKFSNAMGFLSVRYHQETTLGEEGKKLQARALEQYSTGMVSCFGCPVHCRHRYEVGKGPYANGGEGPEYASLASLGATLGNTDLESVLYAAQLCNLYGLDVISTAGYMGWAMRLFQEGIIGREDVGFDLRWGDSEAIIGLIELIAHRKGFGDLLAEGVFARELLPEEAGRYLMHIKNVSIELTDERPVKSFALGLAVATRGCCHMRSRPSLDVTNLPRKLLNDFYGTNVGDDYLSYQGKGKMVWWHELFNAVVDSVGLCRFLTIFSSINAWDYQDIAELLRVATGLDFTVAGLQEIGERIYTTERLFITREGISREDDTLPEAYFSEPIASGPAKGEFIDRREFQRMLDEYYACHGWNSLGRPTAATCLKLGLEGGASNAAN